MPPKYSVLGLLILISSCSKHNEESLLPTAEIVIAAPLPNSTINLGDTIYIQGTAASETGLHGYEVAIRKPGGANLYFQHFHGHADTILMADKWKNVVAPPASLEVLISVILDHDNRRKDVIIPLQVSN